jgi:hypothetical protein
MNTEPAEVKIRCLLRPAFVLNTDIGSFFSNRDLHHLYNQQQHLRGFRFENVRLFTEFRRNVVVPFNSMNWGFNKFARDSLCNAPIEASLKF